MFPWILWVILANDGNEREDHENPIYSQQVRSTGDKLGLWLIIIFLISSQYINVIFWNCLNIYNILFGKEIIYEIDQMLNW